MITQPFDYVLWLFLKWAKKGNNHESFKLTAIIDDCLFSGSGILLEWNDFVSEESSDESAREQFTSLSPISIPIPI